MHILHIRAVCIKSGMRSFRMFAHYNCQLFEASPSAVADPDLRMRGGGEGGHPDPSDKGGPVSKNLFLV